MTASLSVRKLCSGGVAHVAITPAEKAELASRCWQALTFTATALAAGQAHVADRRGGVPADAAAWGWWRNEKDWHASRVTIGWLDGEDLLLDPAESYAIAQQVAGSRPITLSEQSLRTRLHQRGLLASVDERRETLKVRRTIEGIVKEVLHLRADVFRTVGVGAGGARQE